MGLKGFVEKFWQLSARFADEEGAAALAGAVTEGSDPGAGASPELKVVPKPEPKVDPVKETLKGLGPEFEEAFKESGLDGLKAALLEGVRARHELETIRQPPTQKQAEPDPDAIYDQIEDVVEQEVNKALAKLPRTTTEQEAWKAAQRVAARTRNKLLHELAIRDAVGVLAQERQNTKVREAKRTAFFKQRNNQDLLDYADLVEELVEEHGYDGPQAAAMARKFIKRQQELGRTDDESMEEDLESGIATILDTGMSARQARGLQRQFKVAAGRRSSGGGGGTKPGDWGVTEDDSKSYWRSQARDQ